PYIDYEPSSDDVGNAVVRTNLSLVRTASDPSATILRHAMAAVSVRSIVNERGSFADARYKPVHEFIIETHSRSDQLAHDRAGALDQPFLLRAPDESQRTDHRHAV